MNATHITARMAALAAMAAPFTAATAHATTYQYGSVSGTDTELWSTGTGWDATPVGAADAVLTFGGLFSADAAPVSQNDLAGSFTLNTLNLTGTGPDSAAASLTIGGNPLRFSGTAPTMDLNANRGGGTSPALTCTIANPIELTADTLFTGTGNATFRLSGPVSGTGGITKTGSSGLQLYALNIFTGPLQMSAGNVRLGLGAALRDAGPITVGSGTTLFASGVGTVTLNNLSGAGTLDFTDNSRTVVINQTTDQTWGGTTWDRRDGNVTKQGAGRVTVTSLNALQVEVYLTVRAGELRLANGGRLGINRTNRGVTIGQGAIMTLDNVAANESNRIISQFGGTGHVLLNMDGGSIVFLGNSSVDSSEVFATAHDAATGGAFRLNAGSSLFDIRAGNDRHAQFLFAAAATGLGAKNAIVRNAGSTALVQGTQLGLAPRSALTADSANFAFTNGDNTWAPSLTGGIIKGLFAASLDATAGTPTFGLSTYDKGEDTASSTDDVGIRLLNTGETSAVLGAGLNVKATSALTNDGSAINALHLDTNGSIVDGGATTLTVSSGTILSTGGANAIGGSVGNDTLAFGSGEGIFYNAPGSTLTVNMKITGSGGLTKGGDGTLVLKATSGTGQYTGTTYVNGGVLSIDGNSALGQMSTGSGIQLNNGGVLRATTGSFALNNAGANHRAIVVGGATANTITSGGIDVMDGANLSVSGVVSGVGRLVKSGPGTLTLTANNTWSGGTTVAGGRLAINGNTSNHGNVEILDGGTLAGAWGTSKTLALATGKTLTVANGGTLELDAANAPQAVTGNIDLTASGNTLTTTGTVAGEMVLLTYTGTRTGTFDHVTGLPSGYRIDYATPGQVRLAMHRGTLVTIR